MRYFSFLIGTCSFCNSRLVRIVVFRVCQVSSWLVLCCNCSFWSVVWTIGSLTGKKLLKLFFFLEGFMLRCPRWISQEHLRTRFVRYWKVRSLNGPICYTYCALIAWMWITKLVLHDLVYTYTIGMSISDELSGYFYSFFFSELDNVFSLFFNNIWVVFSVTSPLKLYPVDCVNFLKSDFTRCAQNLILWLWLFFSEPDFVPIVVSCPLCKIALWGCYAWLCVSVNIYVLKCI